MKKNSKKKGFTLIELIVVIAILGILALIAIPRLAGFSDKARQANDRELASIIAHSAATLVASGDIVLDGTNAIVITVDNSASESAPLVYTIANALSRGGTAISVDDFTDLIEPLVGADKRLQIVDTIAIQSSLDGDFPVTEVAAAGTGILYDWER